MAEDLFSRKKAKKHKKNRPTPLQTPAESSIIGLTLGNGVRRPARPPGRLKESEMCLVTGPRDFLE